MSYSSRLTSRSELGWGATPARRAACTHGLCIHYDGSKLNLRNKSHSACVDHWRWTRNFHKNTRGWLDIGYSYGVCPHGVILEGRGAMREQAAQPGGNSTWHSCTVLTGPGEPLADTQINGVRELHSWLNSAHGVARKQSCHKDFYNTDCPGTLVTGMVRKGTLLPGRSGGGTTSGNWTEDIVRELPTVGKGDTGEFVQNVQGLCIARSHPEVKVAGKFGDITEKAEKAIQRWGDVADDGIVGPKTWPVLLRVH